MVVKRGSKVLRSFKVVDVQNKDGCLTKFRAGRYTSVNPAGAARKAFSRLCNLKKIRGKCTFTVTVKDTTNDHRFKGKTYTYDIDRKKLKEPLVMMEGTDNEYKIEFVTVAKSGNVEMCKPGRARTRGPMKKKSRRAERRKAELKKKKSQMKKKGVYGKKNNNNKNNGFNFRKMFNRSLRKNKKSNKNKKTTKKN